MEKTASQDINIIPNNFADSVDENKYPLQSSLSTPMQVVKLANNPLYDGEAMTNNVTDNVDENKLPLGLASVLLQYTAPANYSEYYDSISALVASDANHVLLNSNGKKSTSQDIYISFQTILLTVLMKINILFKVRY